MSGTHPPQNPLEPASLISCAASLNSASLGEATQSTASSSPFKLTLKGHMTIETSSTSESLQRALEAVISAVDVVVNDQSDQETHDDDKESPVDMADQSMRTERLRNIIPALNQLWTNDSDLIATATEKLADASRSSSWRVPLGQSGVLEAYIRLLSSERLSQSLKTHTLRLIGNSCADTDANRDIVVKQKLIPVIIELITKQSLLAFSIPVLFNICFDYEPAQQQASECSLSKTLMGLVQSPTFSDHMALLGYVCKLLDLVAPQTNEIEDAPEDTTGILFDLAVDPKIDVDIEDFLALATSGIAYLQHPRFQEALLKRNGLDSALKVLLFSYTRFEESATDDEDSEISEQLKALRINLNGALADISALPSFVAVYPVTSPLSSQLHEWLSSPRPQVQLCACVMLGNVARSDAACIELVQVTQIHKPLIAVLTTSRDTQLLHSTLGFLKNLAIPVPNKAILGEFKLIEPLERLWNLDSQTQLQYSSVSLIRQLCISCLPNIKRIDDHLSLDPTNPASNRSLLSIFTRTDAQSTKMEISRLFTAICRVFSTQQDTDTTTHRKAFFQNHHDIHKPLAYMVSQTQWPTVRSDGWFVMALMCRYAEGAQVIEAVMQDTTALTPLTELLTVDPSIATESTPTTDNTTPSHHQLNETPTTDPQPQPQPTATKTLEIQRIDRENALVLVTELLKQRGEEMEETQRRMFEGLVKGGGEMHVMLREKVRDEAEVEG